MDDIVFLNLLQGSLILFKFDFNPVTPAKGSVRFTPVTLLAFTISPTPGSLD